MSLHAGHAKDGPFIQANLAVDMAEPSDGTVWRFVGEFAMYGICLPCACKRSRGLDHGEHEGLKGTSKTI